MPTNEPAEREMKEREGRKYLQNSLSYSSIISSFELDEVDKKQVERYLRNELPQEIADLRQQLDGARGENERLRQQIASHRCYNALLDEALNSGDGTYKP